MKNNSLRHFPYFLLAVTPFIFLSLLTYFTNPLPWPDEAIYLDTAKTLLTQGVLKTNIFGNVIPGLNEHALWYPPLYFYLLTGWIKIFGTSIETIRTLSLLTGSGMLLFVYYTMQLIFKKPILSSVGTALIAVDFSFNRAAHVARMDMLSLLLLTAGIYTVIAGYTKQQKIWFVATGILGGLSILNHPLGFILPTVACIFLLLQKKIHALVLVCIPIAISLLIWTTLVWGKLDLFFIQYNLQFARKSLQEPFLFHLFKTDTNWRMWGIATAGIYILGLIQLLTAPAPILSFFILGIFVSTTASLWGKEMWYTAYFQPFLAYIIVYLLTKKGVKNITTILALSLGSISLLLSFQSLNTQGDYHTFVKQIAKHIPTESRVFLSIIPDPYFDLQNRSDIIMFEFATVPSKKQTYKDLLDTVDYIILNRMPELGADRIKEYLRRNTLDSTHVQNKDFIALIIQLVPREKRR